MNAPPGDQPGEGGALDQTPHPVPAEIDMTAHQQPVSAQCAPSPTRRRPSKLTRPEALRARLDASAPRGPWEPWSTFLDTVRAQLGFRGALRRDRVPRTDPEVWDLVRPMVLDVLADAGLTATVERTDGPVPIAEHDATRAGLVRIDPADAGGCTDRRWAEAHRTDPYREGYRARMADAHGLVAAEEVPSWTLREFCGQLDHIGRQGDPYRGLGELGWIDHEHAWVDEAGEPVLTIEPHRVVVEQDPGAVADAILGLPLTVQVHPGLWNKNDPGSRVLLVLRWNPYAPVLPGQHGTPAPWTAYEDEAASA